MASSFVGLRRTLVAEDCRDLVYGVRRLRPLSRKRRGEWRRLVVFYGRSRACQYAEILRAAEELGREVERERRTGVQFDPLDDVSDGALRLRLRDKLLAIAKARGPRKHDAAYRWEAEVARGAEEIADQAYRFQFCPQCCNDLPCPCGVAAIERSGGWLVGKPAR